MPKDFPYKNQIEKLLVVVSFWVFPTHKICSLLSNFDF